MAKGIDVSSHQGIIDWEKVKGQIDFAILRCGFGIDKEEYDDKYFKRNADECTRLGIPFGVYLYTYAENTSHASSDADHVLRLIKNYKLEYPIFYDIEDKVQANLSSKILGDIAETFCEKIEQAGYFVGVYASKSWFTDKLTDSRFSRYNKWVAQYNTTCTYGEAGKDYGMWQYASDGTVNGINGRVDMNISYIDYPTIIRNAGLNHLDNAPVVVEADQILHVGSKVVFNGVFKVDEARKPDSTYPNGCIGCYATCYGKPVGQNDYIPCGPIAKCDANGNNVDYNATLRVGDYWKSDKQFTVIKVTKPYGNYKNGIATLSADGVEFRCDCGPLYEVSDN